MPPRNRIEFSRNVKREIYERACNPLFGGAGLWRPACEQCGSVCMSGRFEIDHIVADAYRQDQRAPLTAADGQLLCIPCHKAKSAVDKANIERAKRRSDKAKGVIRPAGKLKSRGFEKPAKPIPSDRRSRIDKQALPSLPKKDIWNHE